MLESKNDESRFGLTRATVSASWREGRAKVYAWRHAAPNGKLIIEIMSLIALIMELNWEWWVIAALTLAYGLAVLVFVVVTIMKSVRADERNRKFEK
ncbi:MAG TPA: hypothetical protein VID27_03035 [Blastocatellia bacterium]|jgi:hypothetical protein